MQKKLCFALSLTVVFYLAGASPVKLDTLEFDKLDTDLDDLQYEVGEEDLDDFSKLLDDADETESVESEKGKVKTLGFKKKHTLSKGSKGKHDIKDLKKLFKSVRGKNQGEYKDDDVYATIKALAAEAVGVKGTEERKYKKGSKTRGFHRVHHKDEYKKDNEFYENDETTGTVKKVGGKSVGFKVDGGVGFKKGHYNHNYLKGIYGKEGFHDRGHFNKKYNGYSDDQGFERSFDNES